MGVGELSTCGDHGRHDCFVEYGEGEGCEVEDGDFWGGGGGGGEEDFVDKGYDIGTGADGASAADDEGYFLGDCGAHRGLLVCVWTSCVVGRKGAVMNGEILWTWCIRMNARWIGFLILNTQGGRSTFILMA